MNQTAVEWFQDQIIKIVNGTCELSEIQIFEQAKEIEKQKMVDFANNFLFHDDTNLTAEQYYNETFKHQREMKQTAVEWLQVQLNENGKLSAVDFYQAQQMERNQIINACNQTDVIGLDHEQPGEQYFNKTFNTKEK